MATSPDPTWPENGSQLYVQRCLDCGQVSVDGETWESACDGTAYEHGPLHPVPVLPTSLAEELADHLQNCLSIIDGEMSVGPDDEARRFLAHYRTALLPQPPTKGESK